MLSGHGTPPLEIVAEEWQAKACPMIWIVSIYDSGEIMIVWVVKKAIHRSFEG
jgi:hypothetical protein